MTKCTASWDDKRVAYSTEGLFTARWALSPYRLLTASLTIHSFIQRTCYRIFYLLSIFKFACLSIIFKIYVTIVYSWRRCQWPSGLRRGSAATRLLGLLVRIPPGACMFVCCECCVFVRQRSLRRAHHSSRGVVPTVLCHCKWSGNLKNEEAKTRKWVVKASERRRRSLFMTRILFWTLFTGHCLRKLPVLPSQRDCFLGLHRKLLLLLCFKTH